jgi:hypothetical protein
LAGGLGMILIFIGRLGNLLGSVLEFIARSLAARALYVVGVYFVQCFTMGPKADLWVVARVSRPHGINLQFRSAFSLP